MSQSSHSTGNYAQKDRLIEQLENASADEEQYVSQLSSIASLCNEVTSHPLYLKMDLLHAAISERMKLVLHKEDASNPLITSQLSEYQEKLKWIYAFRKFQERNAISSTYIQINNQPRSSRSSSLENVGLSIFSPPRT